MNLLEQRGRESGRCLITLKPYLAQLVEQGPVCYQVVGSSPTVRIVVGPDVKMESTLYASVIQTVESAAL